MINDKNGMWVKIWRNCPETLKKPVEDLETAFKMKR